MSRDYTVVYALTRDLQQHECYHHVTYVNAAHDQDAIARCHEDTLPGFMLCVIAVFEGRLEVLSLGKRVLVHEFRPATEASP